MFRSTWLAVSAAAAMVPALPAAARSPISSGLDAASSVQVMSWSEIPFRTVIRQKFDFSCGSAAVATLLSFHYARTTPEQPVFSAMWAAGDQAMIRRSGFSMLDMKRYLDGIGLRTEGFRLSLGALGRLQRPGIVLLNLHGYKHFVILKGIAGGSVLVGDPMVGLTRYIAHDFEQHWNGIFLAIVAGPLTAAPRFNAPDEWGPWARAPLPNGQSGRTIANLTDFLPPLYQISPETLSHTAMGIGP